MNPQIQCAVADGVGYLRLGGELRYDNAGALEHLIEHWFGQDQALVSAVVVDLNQAEFMDSTAIGLLAAIARELMQRGLPPPTLFSTQTEINLLLRSLSLDEVFTLVEQSTAPEHLAALDEGSDQPCSGASILHAHRMLMDLTEANRIAFKPVVDLFREELERRERGQGLE